MLKGAQNNMAQDVNVRIPLDDALILSLYDDIHYLADRFLEKTVRFRPDEVSAYPHLEHQDSSIAGIGLEKIEKVPYEFPDLVKGARNPLKMQLELTPEFDRFFYGDGEEQVFLVPEILVDRAIGDTRLFGYFRNAGGLEVLFAEDFNSRLDNGFSSNDGFWRCSLRSTV